MKKRLNYYTATIEQIAEHFDTVSRAAISSVRKNHKGEVELSQKLDKALELMYLNRLKRKIAEKEAA
jgi:hypothetical protein